MYIRSIVDNGTADSTPASAARASARTPGRVLATPDGSPAPYYFIAELVFDGPQDLEAAMETSEGLAAAADVPNFASGGATLMVVEA